jgi:hypothetical protein
MRNLFVFLITGLIFTACHTNGGANEVISPKKFGAVYWDIQKAITYATVYVRMDTLKNDSIELDEMKQVIFAKHGVSKDLFDKSLAYYNDHPKEMIVIMDSLEVGQKRQQKQHDRLLRPE